MDDGHLPKDRDRTRVYNCKATSGVNTARGETAIATDKAATTNAIDEARGGVGLDVDLAGSRTRRN